MNYSSLTDTLNNLISSEITSWNNIPGGLEKVSESSMGAAWGISQGKLYSCSLPCTGNWKLEIDNILDFTTDDSFVYIITTTNLQFKNGNGTGEWTIVPKNINIQQIFSSGSYIWGQDSASQKYKLAKPGTTGNWITVTDPSNIKITSASSTSLYGIDSKGGAFKTDESLQSKWTSIPQFKGVFTGIFGEQDQSGIYGISGNQIQKCEGDLCTPIESSPVKNISINRNNLWITSENQGSLGNIYTKPLKQPNILDDTKVLDEQRERIVQETEEDYNQKTYTTMLSNELTIIGNMFKNLTQNKVEDPSQTNQARIEVSGKSAILEQVLPILYKILILIGLLIGVYLCSNIFGSYTHAIALIVFLGGTFYYILN
jgi:hypothetical protein